VNPIDADWKGTIVFGMYHSINQITTLNDLPKIVDCTDSLGAKRHSLVKRDKKWLRDMTGE
jgi:hypothetical protein